jgi:DNA-directed RNA polymerase specialized sigma24 family protein
MEEERQARLRRCLGELGPEAAELVKARLAGESYEAICRRVGLKPNQAYKVFHEAKEQLRQCLEGDSP